MYEIRGKSSISVIKHHLNNCLLPVACCLISHINPGKFVNFLYHARNPSPAHLILNPLMFPTSRLNIFGLPCRQATSCFRLPSSVFCLLSLFNLFFSLLPSLTPPPPARPRPEKHRVAEWQRPHGATPYYD